MTTLAYRLSTRLPPGLLRWIGRAQLRSPLLRHVVRAARPAGIVTIKHGPGKGARLIADGANTGYALGTTEPEVQHFFAGHVGQGDVVLDIGANVGFFTLIAAQLVGELGEVHSFEPLPETADALRRNIALNRFGHVRVHTAAVGAESGTARLKVGTSSLDPRLASDGEEGETVVVPIIALNEMQFPKPPTFIKIDAEGAEFDVLHGMSRLLSHKPVILCELHRNCSAADHLAAFGAALGAHRDLYEVSLLEDVDASWWAPHAVALPR